MDPLLSDIEAFLAENSVSASTFGAHALGDRHFVRQMRQGREPRRSVREKVRAYMEREGSRVAA